MAGKKLKSIDIWVGINKDGSLRMFTDMPTRNETNGKWESNHPFVNSLLQGEFEDLCEKSMITWECDANMFSIQINKVSNEEEIDNW